MAYYVVINTYYLTLFLFAASENRLRVRQQRTEAFRALSRFRHTLPVSVIVPGYNEEQCSSPEIVLIPYSRAYQDPGFEDMKHRKPDTRRVNALLGWSPRTR
jgi:hypothetical protein